MKILITNVWLDGRGGTESVVRDLALGFQRRGHRPIVYSPHLGDAAREIHQRGVSVISDLGQLAEAPDVIHGHHYVQTAEAILHFPQVPVVTLSHAWPFWQERPVKFPQVHRYLAVDEAVRDRLVQIDQIAPERVEILHNAVDLRRIPARLAALGQRPLTALAFTKNKAQLPILQAACRKMGVKLDVLGHGADRLVATPEAELVRYDLVFATARMALEALCAGAAVVVCDARGLAGLVTSNNVERLRDLNFGLRSLVNPVTVEAIAAEITLYDAAEAGRVSERVREFADLEPMLDRLETLYGEAIAAASAQPAAEAARRQAMLAFLSETLPRGRASPHWPWMTERQALLAQIQRLDQQLAHARAGIEAGGDPQAAPLASGEVAPSARM
ncbi:glycosyltransferase [Phenylobacterium sp.]|uniref:glycosyltransferase n=1 Tax=Phenylobacterium sp. TaxID=1871053 RepID=UPI00271D3C67|nr:glycosyltransferase [Phenylobacterium sp.]MDO8381332.1 glycosyltransferase [Phenylobacterium sp.]